MAAAAAAPPSSAMLASELMTVARLKRDLVMVRASSSTTPSAPVRLTDSEPARSTRLSLDVCRLRETVSRTSRQTWITLCEREDWSFMPVVPTTRLASPTRTICSSSSAEPTYSSTQPSMKMPRAASCRMFRLVDSGLSRSRTRSM